MAPLTHMETLSPASTQGHISAMALSRALPTLAVSSPNLDEGSCISGS